jgi:hypothetical protein
MRVDSPLVEYVDHRDLGSASGRLDLLRDRFERGAAAAGEEVPIDDVKAVPRAHDSPHS